MRQYRALVVVVAHLLLSGATQDGEMTFRFGLSRLAAITSVSRLTASTTGMSAGSTVLHL